MGYIGILAYCTQSIYVRGTIVSGKVLVQDFWIWSLRSGFQDELLKTWLRLESLGFRAHSSLTCTGSGVGFER